MADGNIDFTENIPRNVAIELIDLDDYSNPRRLNLFYRTPENNESVIVIYPGNPTSKNKTHNLAKILSGQFSSIEEVEGKDLFIFLKKFNKETLASKRFLLAIDFAKKCCTGVNDILTAGTKRGEIAKVTRLTKYPNLLAAANEYLVNPVIKSLLNVFELITNNPNTYVYRRDLLNRFLSILRIHDDSGALTVLETAELYQAQFRHSGRPISHKKLIGTTLLVKGLEYDHAIIANINLFSLKEVYVAITRGSKSLTIIKPQ